MVDVSPPPSEQANPFLPPGPPPIVFDSFDGGLNTNATRPGIDDKQMFWCRGWFPLGPKFLRTMPDVGTPVYTAPTGDVVAFFDFFNIGSTPYMFVLCNTGFALAVNTSTGAKTEILAKGTITSPTRQSVGISQYGSIYLILVAQQTNGYWLWDGTNLYTAGTLAPPVTVTDGGSNYTAPTITATGGHGSGATFSATVTNGIIVSIKITNPGSGYQVGDTVTLSITDSTGSSATATVLIMPFGISGNSVETYTNRVWVSNGAIVQFSAPESPSDFTTADGGGSFTSTDSFLRVAFTQLRQTNGFLYLIADSSVNYISGVQTSGSPAETTFTNQNVDPEIGTPYAATVDVFSNNILFANAFGVHIVYGGKIAKISEPLDGVYASVANFNGQVLSAAKAIVYGKKIWALLLPIIDPVTGASENCLFCWNGKIWFATTQSPNLVYVQHQEINSVLTAYGTDGSSVYPLFQSPSTNFTKIVQSKLWDSGGYQLFKTATRLWGIVQYYNSLSATLSISIDNEQGQSPNIIPLTPNEVTIINSSGNEVTVINNLGAVVLVFAPALGVVVFPPEAIGQNGNLLGFTITTNAADVALISFMAQPEIMGYRG